MNRRNFLRLGAFAAATTLFPATNIFAKSNKDRFHTKSFTLEEAKLSQLQELMAAGKATARSICKMYLARIEELDRHGPMLNSVIETNPDALSIASALDNER